MFVPKRSKHTCTSRSGKPKRQYETSKSAIADAAYWNEKKRSLTTKLVAFKCPNCHFYHLTTKKLSKPKSWAR